MFRFRRGRASLVGLGAAATAAAVVAVALATGGAATADDKPGSKDPAPRQDTARALAPASLARYEIVNRTENVPAGAHRSVGVDCPDGTVVFGGGEYNTSAGGVLLTDSYPSGLNDRWVVWVRNDDAYDRPVTVYAICGA